MLCRPTLRLPSHSALMGGADIDISGVQLTPLDTVLGDGDMLAPSGVVQGNYGRSTMEDQSAWIYSLKRPTKLVHTELNIAPTDKAAQLWKNVRFQRQTCPIWVVLCLLYSPCPPHDQWLSRKK